jgi:hypothetical protein
MPDADQFYLQDSRSYVGNDVLWWAKEGKGYTTDLSKAEVYSRDDALAQHNRRLTDIPWPKEYIDARTRPAVDMQYVKRNEALAGTGITLREPPRKLPDTINCVGCGRFIGGVQRYLDNCPHCGADNRP